MRRLFVGNFDFEHELADSRYQPSVKLIRLNAELATSWLAIAEDGDYLWCPEPIEPEFFHRAAAKGLPSVIPMTRWSDIPADVELVPWGWTDRLISSARIHRWKTAAPPPQLVRELNSRRFSFALEAEWDCGFPGAYAITDFDQLDAALATAREISSRMVIKANWGMSARERMIFTDKPTDAERSWVRKRIAQQGVVFVEPWVDRVEEVGIQIEVPRIGNAQLAGITQLVCNDAGQYQGSWFTNPPDAGGDFSNRWRTAVDIALRAAEKMQDRGYFGPLGIDALRYRLSDGSLHVRPLQDINARWTMGRLSLGWKSFLLPNKFGFWWHFARNDPGELLLKNIVPFRHFASSPACIGKRYAQHRSMIIIGSPPSDH